MPRDRSNRPRLRALLLVLTGFCAPVAGDASGPAPTPLAEPASAPARLAEPVPKPFVVPAASGRIELSADGKPARVQGTVAAGAPTTYLFLAPAGAMFSIGVSSPKSDVRLSIFLPGATEAAGGSRVEDGTIRWSSQFEVATELRLVAHTTGPETPFRFEVSAGPGGL